MTHNQQANPQPGYRPVAVRIVTFIFGGIAAIIFLHLAFVLLEANAANPLVGIVSDVAGWFAFLFQDMFTFDDLKLQAIFNYGLAALMYLVIGIGINSLFRRHG